MLRINVKYKDGKEVNHSFKDIEMVMLLVEQALSRKDVDSVTLEKDNK